MNGTTCRVLGIVDRYGDAAAKVAHPGDCAVVERGGVRRLFVLRCPDGCGEILSINLDPRSGPAWRLYRRRGSWSLFPSIDKPAGCFSHFILWREQILWCGPADENEDHETPSGVDTDRILTVLADRGRASFVEIAESMDEVPWDVLAGCRDLVRRDLLSEEPDRHGGIFLLRQTQGAPVDEDASWANYPCRTNGAERGAAFCASEYAGLRPIFGGV